MSDYNNAVSGTDAEVGHVTTAKVKNTLLLDAEREEDIERTCRIPDRDRLRARRIGARCGCGTAYICR